MKLIKFGATWCSSCKAMEKILKQASEKYSNIKFCNVDIEEDYEEADKYNVRSLPTLCIVNENGEVVDKKTGSLSYSKLCDWIESVAA